MLKTGTKRRRTQAEIKQNKEEALIKQQSIQDKLAEYAAMQEKMADYERIKQENEQAKNLIQ